MKRILVCLAVVGVAISLRVTAEEFRSESLERFGEINGIESDGFNVLGYPRTIKGRLSLTVSPYFETLQPYDLEHGIYRIRPYVLDDLYYETLMLQDPIHRSDRYYPLIAKAIRYPADYSYVVFELDPQARFQDGTPVRPDDVYYSFGIRLTDDPMARNRWEAAVSKVEMNGQEIRVGLSIQGQQAREMIAFLSQTKIVKRSRGSLPDAEISTPYIGTGPYRITAATKARLGLERRADYWANAHRFRRGFFNFAQVEVLASADATSARLLLNGSMANFYSERSPNEAPLSETFRNSGRLIFRTEFNNLTGNPLRALRFNLRDESVRNVKVREALVLAYDFDRINRDTYKGRLRRPFSLLEDSPFAPSDSARPEVAQLMDGCFDAKNPQLESSFETYGNAAYDTLNDHAMRLLAAKQRLLEAGFFLKDGYFHSTQPDGSTRPLKISALIRDDERLAVDQFASDLQTIGVRLTVTKASSEERFHELEQSGEYSLISSRPKMLNSDGWPTALLGIENEFAGVGKCTRGLLDGLNRFHLRSDVYRITAEALARIHQKMYLNIFLGEPREIEYVMDARIAVPAHFSFQRVHLYGFYIGGVEIQERK